ncbi:hypothetical protein [Methanobacterium ferruginis]|uniref:hypothetical protein n=1 Tax=Methanobacterium ferruginis TaxID=710191 RepID=UPI0025729488|nr:hypothetical protein [Methanobacterium ferruginis]BDZ68261.1 hypothetical protein GCM10025860_17090 [Methanobacterium ferruginis]
MVRDAYFLAGSDELRKIYLRYIQYLSVKSSPVNYSLDDVRALQRQNNRFSDTVTEMKKELKKLKGEV